MTGRLGDSRLGEHRLGGETRLGRATTTAAKAAKTSAGRESGSFSRSTTTASATIVTNIERTISLFRDPTITARAAATVAGHEWGSFTRSTTTFAGPSATSVEGGPLYWSIGGRMIQQSSSPDLTPKTLSLSFEVGRDDLEHWRQYDRSGNIQIEVGFGGTFRVVDRAGREEPTSLEPPFRQDPPFDAADYYINSYQESQQGPDRFQISLTFQRTENRSDVFDPVDEAGEPWLLDFDRGTIALEDRQIRLGGTGGTTAGRTVTLPLIVTVLQAATIVDVAGFPDGVVEREVPDGKNFREDTTDGRQTVVIDAPDGSGLESGEYLIRNWSLSFAGYQQGRWRIELDLAKE